LARRQPVLMVFEDAHWIVLGITATEFATRFTNTCRPDGG
jgi:hypothetical protein